jgi:hypothetical protein
MASFDNASNMCLVCHQGRASKVQVDAATPNGLHDPDYDSYDFINIHYYAAAATLFGSDVQAGYEYDGNTYRGQNPFVGAHTDDGTGLNLVDCVGCHMNSSLGRDPPNTNSTAKHTFLPAVEDCNECHSGNTFPDIAPDNNFIVIESLKSELLEAIQAYATTGALPIDSPIYYDNDSYPYWFSGDETAEPPPTPSFATRYRDFDFNMLTAAYNYVVATKDPAGYIHNGLYIKQLLFDSICLMGGDPIPVEPSRINCP